MITQENIPYTDDEIKAMVKTCEKYNKALEKAKKLHGKSCINNILEDLFPELQESKDERIRKALIEMIHDTTGDECEDCYHVSKESVLSWLEKQGEFDDNIITRDDEILQAISVGLTDVAKDAGWSDFGGHWLTVKRK